MRSHEHAVVLEDLEQLPIRVRLDDRRDDVGDLGSLSFATRQGSLPLEAVGRLALRPEDGGITRYDGERCNTISGYERAGALPILVRTGRKPLPPAEADTATFDDLAAAVDALIATAAPA